MKIRAISLWQPWASLVAEGLKKYETRHWRTHYRGPLAIHAAKRTYAGFSDERALIYRLQKMPEWPWGLFSQDTLRFLGKRGKYFDLPTGAVIAVANLVDCYQMLGGSRAHWGRGTNHINGKEIESTIGINTVSEFERAQGHWAEGRYAWHLVGAQKLAEPIPYRGRQGLFWVEVPDGQFTQG